MDTYSLLRAFADSWVLLAMFAFFIAAGVWAFWPSQRAARDEAATIPFREDEQPCGKDCAGCACKTNFLNEVRYDG